MSASWPRAAPRFFLVVIALAAAAAARPAQAKDLVADLTSHLIGITTGFSGTSVVLFGATDGPGDIIAVVHGPAHTVKVRRKSRVAGIWVNTASLAFKDVPSFYTLAATRPPEQLVSPATAARYHIGLANLNPVPLSPEPARVVHRFTEGLIRIRQRQSLFGKSVGHVKFLADRLFRSTIDLPANVPTGTYRIDVYLVRDGKVVDREETRLVVSKLGLDAAVFDFARRLPAGYGAIAVLTALVAGWISGVVFRRL